MDKLTKFVKEQSLHRFSDDVTSGDLVQWLVEVAKKGEKYAVDFGLGMTVAKAASENNDEVAAAAITALGDMGQEGVKYMHIVGNGLARSSKVCVAAATALGQFGEQASGYEDQLAACVEKNIDEGVRAAAVAALGSIGAEGQAATIATLLSDSSPAVAAAACQALGKLPRRGIQEASQIAEKLQEPSLRHAAVCALGCLGQSVVEKHIGDITQVLQDKDSLTRTAAATTLAIASDAVIKSPAGAARVAGLLTHQDPGIRCTAALCLGKLGQEASSYAGDIAVLLKDDAIDDSESYLAVGGGSLRSPATVRRPKCAALASLGLMGAASHAGAICEAFRDKSYEVRLCALDALMQLGDAGRRQAPEVMSLLEDDVYTVRVKACECIAALKAEDVMSSLPDLFEDPSPSVRSAALQALATSPEVAKNYSPEVYKCLGDDYGSVRAEAILALATMGQIGQSYASAIAAELNSEEPCGRAAACQALGMLGDYGAAFAEEVALCQEDQFPMVQLAAAAALHKMGAQGLAYANRAAGANMISNALAVEDSRFE
eukprot:gb/GFBE01013466.1/.p1 GENE.gb/GFBE01013466.1/~~gb/GFBE01013466.1/.p1  ORF type:complete len:547 (+),score=158.08 gb/GFBE01013466.1/:1-1641(+)